MLAARTAGIQRVAVISDDIGCCGLLVHCESEQARDFYVPLIPEFEDSACRFGKSR